MKNKGFTLAELLAVITLLALILVFVLPKILNVYNNKKDEVKDSKARVIYSAADTYLKENIDDYPMTTGMEYCLDIEDLDKENLIPIDVTDITSETAGLKVKIGINGKKTYNLVNKCVPKYVKYSPGDLVYFDPASEDECSESTFNLNNIKNGTSTCYKWRVITVGDTEENDDITLQMDHNIVNTSVWTTSTSLGPYDALRELKAATSGWSRLPGLTYSYDTSAAEENYGTLSCINGTCTSGKYSITIVTNLKARMITGEEVRALTMDAGAASGSKADKWSLASPLADYYRIEESLSGTGNETLAWLGENTGAYSIHGLTNAYDDDNWGYWTLSPVSDFSGAVWCVGGDLDKISMSGGTTGGSSSSAVFGLRPVITIPKSWVK